jgi:CHRD domain
MRSADRMSGAAAAHAGGTRWLPRRTGLRAGVAAAASVALAGGTLALVSTAGASVMQRHAGDAAYSFTTLDNQADPTFNQLLGISNTGLIAGYFGSGAKGHPNKGYLLQAPYGTGDYTSENFPGSKQTQVTGLNNRGVTVGFWSAQNTASMSNDNFGFYARGGQFHQVSYPAGNVSRPPVNQLLGVSDHDVAVGFYTNAQGLNRGYEYNIGTRRFRRVLVPGIPNLSKKVTLTATAINNGGGVAGFYQVGGGNTIGFYLTGHHAARLAYPGASMTQPFGVNDHGEVVGAYTLGSGSSATSHGFTWTAGHGFTTVDDPSGIGSTVINGVNDHGDLVGFYTDKAGNTDGMLATPAMRQVAHLNLKAMPTGTITFGTSGGDLTVAADAFGLTPGSSHAVALVGPGGGTVATFSTLTASSTGVANTTLDSSYTGTIPDGSRLVIYNGTGSSAVDMEHITQTGPLHGAGSGTTRSLTAVEVSPGGVSFGTPHGHATIVYNPGARTLSVTVDASGLTPGKHAAHIHLGSCQSQGGVLYMLMDFVANSRGQISHQTRTVSNVASGIPASGWYLNLHQGTSQTILSNGSPTIFFRPLLCANIH